VRAHLEVFGPALDHPTQAFKGMAVLIQIVNESTSFNQSAFRYQRNLSETRRPRPSGDGMGVTADHPAVRIVVDTWTLLFATSFADLGRPERTDRVEESSATGCA